MKSVPILSLALAVALAGCSRPTPSAPTTAVPSAPALVYAKGRIDIEGGLIRLAASRDELRIVADQFGAPTGAALLADASTHIATRYLRDGRENFPFGLYHLAAGGETSWHGFAQHIVAMAAAANSPLQATIDCIHPIPAAEYPTPAARPANSCLDTTKFRTAFGLQLPDWTHGVDQVLDVLLKK
jgi:dTDP-4-dehydrorhamnose reductase